MAIRFQIAALAALAIGSAATAATTYTSEAAFLTAAAGGLTFEGFESPVSVGGTSVVLADVAFSCSGSTYCPGFFGVRTGQQSEGVQAVFGATPDSLVFTFDAPVTHFGIDVIGIGTTGATDLTIAWGSNSVVLYTGVTGGSSTVWFSGIIDSTPFTTVTFTGSARDDGIDFDRLVYKGGVVPEPATWAMLITGFGLVGFAARRRSALTA